MTVGEALAVAAGLVLWFAGTSAAAAGAIHHVTQNDHRRAAPYLGLVAVSAYVFIVFVLYMYNRAAP